MRKIIALMLCVLMLSSFILASCGEKEEVSSKPEASTPAGESKEPESDTEQNSSNESENVSEEISGTTEDPYRDADGKYVSKNLPAFKEEWSDKETFTVLVYSNKVQNTYFSEEIESLYETTDAQIIEGVNERNKWIEDTYGITVKALPVDDVNVTLKLAIESSAGEFDAAMPFMANAAVLAQDGSLYNLAEFDDYIHLDAPWWDSNATKSLSIANKVFFTTGDISLMQKIVSNGVAFNKKLMHDSFQDVDVYQLVRDNKWTLDRYYQMCKSFTRQGDESEQMDENDFWGSMGGGVGFYYAAGETLSKKDPDDYPYMSIGADMRSVTVAQKVLGYLEEKGTWYITVDDFTDQTDKWNKTVKMFGEGKTLFFTFAFSALKKFRAYDVVYGILPNPKYDEAQEDYFSNCTANMAFGVCIPYYYSDPEYSAYMLELLAVGAKNHISNAYYSSVLKGKDANTDDDEDMLDKIFNNIVYDPALVFNFGGLNSFFSTAKSNTVTSTIESMKDTVESAINDLIESFEAQ